MGYFRLFYYISYIFNTICRILKRHGKQVIWFLAIILFVIFCALPQKVHAAFEGDYNYADPNIAFKQMYDDVCIRWLKKYINAVDDDYKDAVKDLILDRRGKTYFYFGGGSSPDGRSMMNQFNYDDSVYYMVYIPNDTRCYTRTLNSDVYMSIPNISCSTFNYINPNLGYYYNWHIFRVGASFTEEALPSGFSLSMPSFCFGDINEYIYDYFFNNFTLEEIELLREMESKVDSIDNTINQTHDYITAEPSDEDFSDEDLPSDSGVTDTTEEYTDNLFTSFYNALTKSANRNDNIIFNVPFTNKNITIPYNYTQTYFSETLQNIISRFWYFAFGILIYKDIMHKFNKIRSGDIEHVQDNNIKEDIL